MGSPTAFFLSEFAAAVFGAILDIALAAIFVYAYTRCRQPFFLILCVGSLAFVLSNAYAAILVFSAITRAPVFPPSVTRVLTSAYVAINPVAGVISFIGTILLVRFALKLYRREQT